MVNNTRMNWIVGLPRRTKNVRLAMTKKCVVVVARLKRSGAGKTAPDSLLRRLIRPTICAALKTLQGFNTLAQGCRSYPGYRSLVTNFNPVRVAQIILVLTLGLLLQTAVFAADKEDPAVVDLPALGLDAKDGPPPAVAGPETLPTTPPPTGTIEPAEPKLIIATPVDKPAPKAVMAIPLTGPVERVIWSKTPIVINLQVGQERLVHFPATVQVGVPGQLNVGPLRTQIVDNTVYWLAKEPFEVVRLQVANQTNGNIYLVDLKAIPFTGLIDPPIEIIEPKIVAIGTTGKKAALVPRFDYVQLTRFAVQQLYAPARLMREQPGIGRVPLNINENVPLVRGGAVEALPLVSWQAGEHFITAVRLRNTMNGSVDLDPRALRGTWLTATFQHGRLAPAGDVADTTAVYLISSRPFAESLRPFVAATDTMDTYGWGTGE